MSGRPLSIRVVEADPAGPRRIGSWMIGLQAVLAATVPPLLLILLVLIVWEALLRLFQVPSFVLPTPSAIGAYLVVHQGELIQAAWITASEVLFGFVLSGIAGAALALLIARFEAFGRALYPLIVLFQTVPKVALAPLFILWFGFDLQPKIVLIVVIAFFPVALDMLAGLQSVDPNLVALMRSVGASRTEILRRVQIPHAMPHLMSGLKIAITLSVIGAIVGEFAGASAGLGYMIEFASTQMQTAAVFAALVEVSVLGVVFYYAIEIFERYYVSWVPKNGGHRG